MRTLFHYIRLLDELGQMPKSVIEALRGPIEDRYVSIARLRAKVEFPASFMLVAATNPCPCWFYGEGDRCTCTVGQRAGYLSRLSGPIMDRIDIQVWMHPVETAKLVRRQKGETSAAVAERVLKARIIQKDRFVQESIFTNAEMSEKMVEKYCPLSPACQALMEKLIDHMGLSARAFTRIIKVARTIADLSGVPDITPQHIAEAAGYRFLDKKDIGR